MESRNKNQCNAKIKRSSSIDNDLDLEEGEVPGDLSLRVFDDDELIEADDHEIVPSSGVWLLIGATAGGDDPLGS